MGSPSFPVFFSGAPRMTLTIPSTIPIGNKTYTVIGIGPNVFRGNKTLKTISLPTTIRVIETGAFAYCNAMIDH